MSMFIVSELAVCCQIENIINEMHDQENGLNARSTKNSGQQVHFELRNAFTGEYVSLCFHLT